MSTVKEIEAAIRKLSRKDLAALRDWLADYDADAWDRQIEKDAKAGKLDKLADKALKDFREGRCTPR
jgi:hypothetical protein